MSQILKKRGALIVLEGCDRTGKTTQGHLLVKNLCKNNMPAQFMNYPDRTTKIGKMINDYLTIQDEVEDHAVHLLFSANRWESVPKMKKLLNEGTTLVIDRYAFSGVAFSSGKKDMMLNWCKQCDVGIPRPDVVLFFELSQEEARKRSGFGNERYETEKHQQLVKENYKLLRDNTWKIIDASKSIETLEKNIMEIAIDTVNKASTEPLLPLWKDECNGVSC